MDNEDPKKKSWEELLFGTFERIASTPGRLRDPKESLTSAFDWVKETREEVGERIKDEVSDRMARIDWDQMGKKVADHLAENYQLKIDANIRWEAREDAPVAQKTDHSKEDTDPPENPHQ